MLEEVAPQQPQKAPAARTDLIQALFLALNKKQSERLLNKELFVYANFIGYEGDVQEFWENYEELCDDAKCDVKVGLDEKAFRDLVDGDEEGDYFGDDEQLRTLFVQLQRQREEVAAMR